MYDQGTLAASLRSVTTFPVWNQSPAPVLKRASLNSGLPHHWARRDGRVVQDMRATAVLPLMLGLFVNGDNFQKSYDFSKIRDPPCKAQSTDVLKYLQATSQQQPPKARRTTPSTQGILFAWWGPYCPFSPKGLLQIGLEDARHAAYNRITHRPLQTQTAAATEKHETLRHLQWK